MIVERQVFDAKAGRALELVELLKAEGERLSLRVRYYTPHTGTLDVVVADIEFDSLAEHERFWTEWAARPETPVWMETLYGLAERGIRREIWNVIE